MSCVSQRLARRLACAVALCTVVPLSAAAGPLDDYVAARDKAITTAIAAAKAGKGGDEAVMKREEAAMKDLQKRLAAALGPLTLKGLNAPDYTLQVFVYDQASPTRQLDGLVFRDNDGVRRIVVTAEPIFQNWLAARAKDDGAPPALAGGVKAAMTTAEFYTDALGYDGGYFQPYVELPVAAAPGETAVAMLGLQVEEPAGNATPNQITVVRIADGKVMVGEAMLKVKDQPIAACDAIWKPYEAKADALQKKVEKDNKPEDPRWDEVFKIAADGSDAYRACFAKEAPKDPSFAAATKAAETLLKQARGQ